MYKDCELPDTVDEQLLRDVVDQEMLDQLREGCSHLRDQVDCIHSHLSGCRLADMNGYTRNELFGRLAAIIDAIDGVQSSLQCVAVPPAVPVSMGAMVMATAVNRERRN